MNVLMIKAILRSEGINSDWIESAFARWDDDEDINDQEQMDGMVRILKMQMCYTAGLKESRR